MITSTSRSAARALQLTTRHTAGRWQRLQGLGILQHRALSGHASAADGDYTLHLTDRSADRLALLRKQQNVDKLSLRLSVEGGGCSGFQYKFETTTSEPKEDDFVFENKGQALFVDPTSMELVKGAQVDFTEDLIRRSFEVVDNPNAEAGCGCGASFAAKIAF